MSKILSVAMPMGVATVTIDPRMSGTITFRRGLRLLAQSRRAASSTTTETLLIAAESTTIAKPVWSQIMMRISAGMLTGNGVAQGTGSFPKAVQIAFARPNCGWLGGWYAYTNLQMTVAPTREIASGVKMKTLASASRLMRSKSAAMTRPRPTLKPVTATSQIALFRKISRNAPVPRLVQLARVNASLSSWKLRITVATAGYTR